MKNTRKPYYSILISLVMLLAGTLCFAFPKQALSASAQDDFTPAYLTVYKNTKTPTGQPDEYTYTRIGNPVSRGDAVFTNNGEVLILRLAHPEEQQTNAIMYYSMQIFVNNQSTIIKPQYIKNYPNLPVQYLDIVLDLYATAPDQEGKYNITVSYMEYTFIEGNPTNAQARELSFYFYLYKTSTYYSSGNPAVSVSNVDTYQAGSSSSFARTHEFYYNNNMPSLQKLSLPTFTFNTNKFELLIIKTVSGTSTESKIVVDQSGNLTQIGTPIVMLQKIGDNAIVTFNDIGSYTVQYLFIHKLGNEVEYMNNINKITKPDKLNIFGFQIYHADINGPTSNSKKEFKVFDQNNSLVVGHQTDITYTQISTQNVQPHNVGNYYTVDNIDTRINFNAVNLTVPSTNQAPVEFNYNASIIKNETESNKLVYNSYYLKLSHYDTTSQKNLWVKTDNYNGSAFTDVGTYLVKITYTSSLSSQNIRYTQWFFFQITNETPSYKVLNSEQQEINSNSFTKNAVTVQFEQQSNPFNSDSELIVYSKTYNQSTYSNPVQVPYNQVKTFTENSNYKVVLLFGKNLAKSKVTYFTIDNTPITGITARNVSVVNGHNTKGSAFSFFTNQNVAVEWNEKAASGNTITASYKFLPIVANTTNFSSIELESYYTQGNYVPVDYTLDYKKVGGTYPTLRTVPYSNTVSQSNLPTELVLTQQGMYIFHLVDKAGNEQYFAFTIDKTNPVVLQKMTHTETYVTDFSSLNLIAEDAIIQWGKYKVIKTNMDLTGVDLTSWTMIDKSEMAIDPWLLQILRSKARLSQTVEDDADFKIITVNANQNLYLTPKIKAQAVMVQIGENLTPANATNYGGGELIDQYSYAITVAKEIDGNTVIYENSYSFYVSDESKTDGGYSTVHSIQVSTDISKTAVRFEKQNGSTITYDNLVKHDYEVTDQDQSIKSIYYMPINYDVLQLQYLIAPTENSIEVAQIYVDFYAYISNYLIFRGSNSMLQTNMYYTREELITYTGNDNQQQGLIKGNSYRLDELIEKGVFSYSQFEVGTSFVLAKTADRKIVYDYSTSTNLGVFNGEYYVYDINTIMNTQESKIQTRAGKYVITRTYRNLPSTKDVVGDRYDFMTRTLTFIVDREDVVSAPVTLNIQADPSANPVFVLVSQVGGSSYLEVLSGHANSTLFTEIYRAKNYSGSSVITSILRTNKSPVKVSIPLFKFGQVLDNNFLAYANNMFYESNPQSYIRSFEMLVSVKHLATGEIEQNTYTIRIESSLAGLQPNEDYVLLNNGLYLITTNVSNGYIILPTFSEVGQYEITISQNNANLKGNKSTLTFYMEIVNIAPSFEVQDTVGNTLGTDSSGEVFYTNKNTLRVTWTDPSNIYMAKIDKNNITYFDGTQNKTVPAVSVVTLANGLTHYFDINLSNYSDGTTITVTLSYEGEQSAYPAGYSSSKMVRIDRIAPTNSLDKLMAKAGESTVLNATTLREGHNQPVGYNKTINTQNSIFKNFAFAVDVSDFQSLIFASEDKIELRLKHIPNKYTDASYVELDPSSTSALTQLRYSGQYQPILTLDDIANLTLNTYYEVAEVDIAGNITIYSIYLTSVAKFAQQEQALKDDNSNYKQTLSDDFKFIKYSNQPQTNAFVSVLDLQNSANNYKIFSKDNFVLEQINPYYYPWSVITFNNIKYIHSPALPNAVYRWTASGAVAVQLSDVVNFGLSRYNYTITIKNLPKNNVNILVVVSNQKLNITEPAGTNEKLLITQTNANDTEYVMWQSVTVWEYRNGVAVRYAVFNKGIAQPVEYSPEVEGYNLATYTTEGAVTTFNISAVVGAHYRYKVVDNFGNIYTLHHLYGQEYVEPIVSNDGKDTLITQYENNQMYYVSNVGFSFTFFPSITVVKLTVEIYNTDGSYSWPAQTVEYNITGSSVYDNQYFRLAKYPSYTTIVMTPSQTPTSRFEGVKIVYIVQTSTTILEEEQNLIENETVLFKVYNLVPTIQLKGKNRQSLNDLMNNTNNLTSEPVTIEFVDTSGFDFPVEVLVALNDGTPTLIQSGTTFSQVGTYTIYRRYIGIMGVFEIPTAQFTISDAAWQFYSVVAKVGNSYVEISPTGAPYVTEDSPTGGTSIYQHYIVNTLDFEIRVNSSQYVEIVGAPGTPSADPSKYYTSTKRGISTFVRTLSNLHATGNPTVNYFETKIAISYIPSSNKILNSFYYLDAQGNQNNLTGVEKTYALEKDVDNTNSVIISWNSYYMIAENKITAEIRFGQNNELMTNAKITTKNGISSITLSRSGNYQFVFSDLAGNVHKFDYNAQIPNSTSTYEFVFLKNVIFNVNGGAPIPFAIYNTDVEISIPSYTISFYDTNARPQIVVERNGLDYKGYQSSTHDRVYTFSEPGLYKVWFTAKRGTKELREEAYYFQIIPANELTWAFDIEQYEEYYIQQILKDGVDVTQRLTNLQVGKTINITKNGVTKTYLSSLFISLYDEQTGAGNWQITINTNNDLEQTFTYAFRVNSATPPINISLEEGGSTRDTIKVVFNARNLFEQVGDVIVKIGNQKPILINAQYFEESNFIEVYNVEITEVGDSFVQILTPSERLLFSYKVTRIQPLNAVAIIIIVIASLAVAGAITVFVLLRKKMRIR